jgi:transcriptional regulator with XRE-family HTH domain
VSVGVEVVLARSRVELFEQIRRDRRIEGLSIRELAERHRVHRRTVRQALAGYPGALLRDWLHRKSAE